MTLNPKTLIRAARLTYRAQVMAPAGLSDWVANFRKYLKQPPRVIAYCRALIEAGKWEEFTRVADETTLLFAEGARPIYLHDLDALERRIVLECLSLAAQSAESLTQLSRAVKYIVEAGIPGDFVECGVYRGGSIVAIIRTLQALGRSDRTLWLYDTFEGFPQPEEIDQHYRQTAAEDGGLKSWALHKRDDGSGGSDWCYSPIEDVRCAVSATGYPQERTVFVKGLVEDTIPGQAPAQIAFLRLDTDFYRSTRHELVHLYPRMARGSVLILDDYGAYQGARVAVDAYFAELGLKVLLARVDENVRLLVKP